MQALLLEEIGRLRLAEVPEPVIERPDDVLIEVRAVGICGSDLHGYTGETGRRKPPLVMGHEASGTVVESGEAAARLKTGTRVAIHPLIEREGKRLLMGMNLPGAYAQRVVWPAKNLHPLADSVSFEAGTLAEPLAVAIHAVDKVALQPSSFVAVVGCGPIGLLVVAVLKARGVELVMVTDLSDARLDVARKLGADVAVNARAEDPVAAVRETTGGVGADVVFEVVGVGATVAQAHRLVRDCGTAVWIGNNHKTIELDMQEVVTRELTIRGTYGMSRTSFEEAVSLLAEGAIDGDLLINRRARLSDGPGLFDELLASPQVIKCVFSMG